MHIGLLIYGSLDTVSGGFVYDRNLVRYLQEQGDRVEVISLPWRAYPRSLADNLNSLLQRRLRQADFDVLLQDELVHPSCFWLNQCLRPRINYPIVGIVHHLRCRERRFAWKNRLYRKVEKRYLDSVDGLVCVSHTTKKDVEDLVGPGRPLVVASPGRDGLPGALTTRQIRARVEASGPLRLLFVGNVIRRKELHTLLAALSSLPRNNWRLTVVGSLDMEPGYVKAIRRRITSSGLFLRVALLGALPAPELAVRCAASHVMAVPSSYEGFGIVYLEGMHFGLPAIASTRGAAREIITHGQNGFLVEPGDARALAQCLEALMTNRARVLEMNLAAHRSAAAHPTWNQSAARVRAFLQDLLGLSQSCPLNF
ncbi:MAG: glycosyltransferase family 4 protein [Deltaproteobacteria bacterium]